MGAFLPASLTKILGDFDPVAAPAKIAPVPAGGARPRWSVMIPVFNCAALLRLTLASVLREDPGPEHMQIEVVDDVSTKDDPEAVVREMGAGRVRFFRKPRNGGSTANFNTCLERSRGHLIHVLHGDDLVRPGFYQAIEAAATAHPETAAFFTRCWIVDETGVVDAISPRMRTFTQPTRLASEIFYDSSPIRTPGAVIRRSFYEQHGGFHATLVHTADWEMWVRSTTRGGAMWLAETLADYRFFAFNETSRMARSAVDLVDRLRLGAMLAYHHEAFDFPRYQRALSRVALRRMQYFRASGDIEAAEASERLYHALTSPARRRLHQQWDREIDHRVVEAPNAARRRALITTARAAARRARPIFLWGAGKAGLECLQRLRAAALTVTGFIDSDARKHGSIIEGLPVVDPARLDPDPRGEGRKPFVVVASMYSAEIVATLEPRGFRRATDYVVA